MPFGWNPLAPCAKSYSIWASCGVERFDHLEVLGAFCIASENVIKEICNMSVDVSMRYC